MNDPSSLKKHSYLAFIYIIRSTALWRKPRSKRLATDVISISLAIVKFPKYDREHSFALLSQTLEFGVLDLLVAVSLVDSYRNYAYL